jgi:hypothetical protein
VNLLIVFGLVGIVSAHGNVGSYSPGNSFSNWASASDPGLDSLIAQENLVIEKLLEDKTLLEKTLQDKTLDNQVLQEKNLQLKTLEDKISQEKVNQDNLLQQKIVQESIYQVNIKNSGSVVSGLKVKFPKKLTTLPGSDYISYNVYPYSDDIFPDQKFASAKKFNETQNQFTQKVLLKACSERLGSYLCTKGNKVAF